MDRSLFDTNLLDLFTRLGTILLLDRIVDRNLNTGLYPVHKNQPTLGDAPQMFSETDPLIANGGTLVGNAQVS